MDSVLYQRNILLHDLYHILSPAADQKYIDNIILTIVNKHQSSVEWEKILHKIKQKYSYTFQQPFNHDAIDIWMKLLHTSNTEDTNTDLKSKVLEAALSRSNHHKPQKKKVSKIKLNQGKHDLNDPPRYVPDSSTFDKKYIESSRNIDIYSSLSNKRATIKSLFDNQANTDYSIISKRLGNFLELIDEDNYPSMIRRSNIRYNDKGLPIIPNVTLYIDESEITIDVVVDESNTTDIIIKYTDIKSLEDMNIFISE